MSISLKELAEICDARIVNGNPDQIITAAANLSEAKPSEISHFTNEKYRRYLNESKASALFVIDSTDFSGIPDNIALLLCPDPEMAFITAVKVLHPSIQNEQSIDERAAISPNVYLGLAIHIGAFAVIRENAYIGDGSEIHAGAYIGRNVRLGNNCQIFPYSVIYDDVTIGNNVIIHSGSIIGADGFGYKFRNGEHVKVPQVGNVIIDDNVEIGANCCIDRATLGSTKVGKGTKIDNLVQIGHNNSIGKNVIMCGQTGVGGSCEIGDNVILAANSGISDHIRIGKNSVILARTGVAKDVPENKQMFGMPAKERRVAWRELSAMGQLPELIKRVKGLEKKLS